MINDNIEQTGLEEPTGIFSANLPLPVSLQSAYFRNALTEQYLLRPCGEGCGIINYSANAEYKPAYKNRRNGGYGYGG